MVRMCAGLVNTLVITFTIELCTLPPLYWLNELTVTGKNIIARIIAEKIFVDTRLRALFFCSRGS